MRHITTIPVFTPYPATGYGFDDDTKKMLGGLTWGDVHHPSLSETNAAKIVKIMDLALRQGVPVVGLNDSGGARIQEGVARSRLRDHLPAQHAGLRRDPADLGHHGALRGGAVYSPAITDFTIMVEDTSYMFVTGPDVIKAVTHEEVSKEELGGAMSHNARSGVAHFAVSDDRECLALIRELLGFFPSNNLDDPPRVENNDSPGREEEALDRLVPESPFQPYDMLDLIHRLYEADESFQTLDFMVHTRLYFPHILVQIVLGTLERVRPILMTAFAFILGVVPLAVQRRRVTGGLAAKDVGDLNGFRGPYGNWFPLEEWEGKNIVFIAGGIALPPMRCVIWNALDLRDQFKDITIIYGARTVADLVYKQELEEWSKRSDVKVITTVDPGGETPDWKGPVGLSRPCWKKPLPGARTPSRLCAALRL
jgi:hypothetical protein